MMVLCLGVEFITGYYVATHPSARNRAEWPPHPARVFMALAAAYFETGEAPTDGKALEFLESIRSPASILASAAAPRSSVTHYVPVNDKLAADGAPLPMLRSRQPREFPRVRPDDAAVYFVWPEVVAEVDMLQAVDALCRKVTRIGHSASLVRVWATGCPPMDGERQQWQSVENGFGEQATQLRAIEPGGLAELRQLFRADDRAEFDRLDELCRSGHGPAKKLAREQIQEQFEGQRPHPVRPEFQITTGYQIAGAAQVKHTIWGDRLLICGLKPLENARLRLDIAEAPAMVLALHKAMIKAAQSLGPIPEFISGHKPDGTPSERPHCVAIPLPFVGHEHADGHLLGVAIALPQSAGTAERRLAMKCLAHVSKQGLLLGSLGKWQLSEIADDRSLHNLRPETWTGGGRGQSSWASVTPVAFDAHPKSKDIDGYQDEIRAMLAQACQRVGLPAPEHVRFSHVGFIPGVPPSHQFPRLARKDGSQRRQLHARLVFAEPIRGPVLLGAGRYRGYGLFRPVEGAR